MSTIIEWTHTPATSESCETYQSIAGTAALRRSGKWEGYPAKGEIFAIFDTAEEAKEWLIRVKSNPFDISL